MDRYNPEIEAILDALAKVCCNALEGNAEDETDRTNALLTTLLMSGYSRTDGQPLSVDLEHRVKAMCLERASHRGAELSAVTSNLATQFAALVRRSVDEPRMQ